MGSKNSGALVFLLPLLLLFSYVAMTGAARNLQEVEASPSPPQEEDSSPAGAMPDLPAVPHLTVPGLPSSVPELPPLPELPPSLPKFEMPLFPEMHLPAFPGMPWKPAVHMPTIPGFNFPDLSLLEAKP